MQDFYEERLSVARELLEKAQLPILAHRIESIQEWNLIGSSPQKIFCGVPIKVLRSFESEHGWRVLQKEKSRSCLLFLYKSNLHQKASWLFRAKWNLCQCLYWQDLVEEKTNAVVDQSTIDVLKMLAFFDKEQEYLRYKEYCLMREELAGLIHLPLAPREDQYEETLSKAEYLLKCRIYEERINEILYRQYVKNRKKFELQDPKYEIIFPMKLKDFLIESEVQHNCLWKYVVDVCLGRTKIIFLRKKNNIYKPYVTMEIEETVLRQVKGKYNSDVGRKVKEWVMDYCIDRDIETIECEDLYIDEIFESL